MRVRGADVSVLGVPNTSRLAPHLTASHRRASASGHAEGVSNEEFRAAMSRLAAGVVLVTAHDPAEPDGPHRAARTSA